jgi:hypothetical protein
MKKSVFFAILLLFLGGLAWGQQTYVLVGWNNPNDWTNPANWTVNGSTPATYPGENPGDTAEIGGWRTVVIPSQLPYALDTLIIDDGATFTINGYTSGDPFTVTTLTISGGYVSITGSINVTGMTTLDGVLNSGTLNIVDLTIDSGGISGTQNSGTVTMNGAPVTVDPYTNSDVLTISNVTTSTGTIHAIGRNVTITTSGSGAEINSINAASLTVNGDSQINADITTTGNQNYNGTVTLDGNRRLISTTGTITTSTENVSATSGVTIEAGSDITIGSGGITAGTNTTGVIRLESGGGITIGGTIIGHQLIALANTTSGTVEFGASVISITNPTANTEDSADDKLQAPIYVRAYDFTATGTDTIVPGSGELCLELGATKIGNEYNLNVAGQKYHIHDLGPTAPDPTKHLVYYNGASPTGIFTPNEDYHFVEASSSSDTVFYVNPDKNIYIYNVGTNSHNITFTVNTGANHTGFIEIEGSYTSTGLTLHPGSGGVRLNGATVHLDTDFNTNGTTLTLDNANSSITATTVTLGGTVTGAGHSLTITGNAVFNGIVSNVATLSVSGISTINADIDTTGAQTYTGAVTVNGDRTFTANGGELITFGSTVGSSDATPRALTINNANVQFDGAAGGAGNPISVLTVNAGTAAMINANITTTGNQSYGGAVTLSGAGNHSLVSTGGDITIAGTVTALSGSVMIQANGITTEEITANGATGIIRLESTGANIAINGNITGHQLLAIAANGSVTVGAVTINAANTGNEGESAAIYVRAASFIATGPANSIVPGGPGGQLCLNLPVSWTNSGNVVDGAEYLRWHCHLPTEGRILYSFTEDENGDGRLDRIRVQTNLALNGDFFGFDVRIEGYEIDHSKGNDGHGGHNGFELVSGHNDSFYIYLNQKSELDGGSTPQWSVTRNESLKDSTDTSFMGNSLTDRNITPIDTIPPRIAYTLALPGHNQIYVQMSEPVNPASALIDSFDIGGTYTITAASSPIGSHGYLLNLDDSFDVDTLAGLTITGSLIDGFFSVEDMADHSTPHATIDGVAPKYPVNWGYTAYAADSGSNVLVPPNRLINNTVPLSGITHANSAAPVIRRVTDVLVSMSPNSLGTNYFAWPVWAENDKGNIRIFDGAAFLEAGGSAIELGARINTVLAGSDLRLFYKITAHGNSKTLWQPFSSLYYFAPDGEADMLSGTPVPPSNLFNYSFPNIDSGNRVEFYFYIGSSTPNTDQFIARLDIRPGAAIPSNWYNLVRPFSFDVQGVQRQRGGVTILNNVINSDAGEEAVIRYILVRPGRVTIQVYTLDGTLVKSLMRNEYREAGEFDDVRWNGSNNSGRAVARGMYFVRVVAPDIDEIRKIMVVR